jgi:hypothetical protein
MILFYLNHDNKKQARIIRQLFNSYTGEKHIHSTARFDPNNEINQRADIILFAGMLRGEGLIYRYCKENNKKFLYVDHAYLDRGYNVPNPDKEWMRVTLNAFTWSLNQTETVDRWNQHFAKKYTLLPWNKKPGKNILVLPPSEATKFLFPESVGWTNKAIEDIKAKTNAPIYIREKPDQPVVDSVTNQVIDRLKFDHPRTIEQDMENAKIIVTFNSAVPVMGTIKGIPCYCSPYAAAYPMSINLSYLNNPPEPERQPWLNQLVHHQYRTLEIRDGTIWKMLEKYMR